MNLIYFIKLQWIIRLFFMWSLYYVKSSSYCLNDLKRVCIFTFIDQNLVTPPKNVCTAVGTHTLYQIPTSIDFNQSKKDLPYVVLWSNGPNTDFIDMLENSFDDTFNQISDCITNSNMDVLILDTYEVTKDSYTDYNSNLKKLGDKLKSIHTNLLIGFQLENNVEKYVKGVYCVDTIDSTFDLYYVSKNEDFDDCTYNHDKASMLKSFESPDNVTNTINALIKLGFKPEKLFPAIRVVVNSFKNDMASKEDWTNSHMCTSCKISKFRRQCVTNLENLYLQGSAIYNLTLTGAFIISADNDDYDDSCKCGAFPAIRAIFDGLTGLKDNTSLTGCTQFGNLPTCP